MKISESASQLLIHVEDESDVDELLGLIGEADRPESDQSYDLRRALHSLKERYLAHRQQASLFDPADRPDTVLASAPAPSAPPWGGTSAEEWALAHSSSEVTSEWDDGYAAGWRGDEIVTLKSPLYVFAYEQGQVARQAQRERYQSADGN